jgi:hypothetical protein
VGPRPCVGPTAGWRGAEEKNLCPRGESNPPFSGRAAHPAAILLQSASAHRNDISFSTVYTLCHFVAERGCQLLQLPPVPRLIALVHYEPEVV